MHDISLEHLIIESFLVYCNYTLNYRVNQGDQMYLFFFIKFVIFINNHIYRVSTKD